MSKKTDSINLDKTIFNNVKKLNNVKKHVKKTLYTRGETCYTRFNTCAANFVNIIAKFATHVLKEELKINILIFVKENLVISLHCA